MKRHGLITRLWHWLNAAALIVLFMSGLNISNAHRYLYWGDYGFDPADAWMSVMRFPGWTTLPSGRYDLAAARDWHSLAAWVFALALLVMWVTSLANKHFSRDLKTSWHDWSPRSIAGEIRSHVAGRFEGHGAIYNTLQKMTYGIVLGIFLPMMVFTGLAISPGFEPAAPWLVDLLGGRQSARSLHFIFTWAIVAFFAVHIVMVIVSRPFKQVWDMIAGGSREADAND